MPYFHFYGESGDSGDGATDQPSPDSAFRYEPLSSHFKAEDVDGVAAVALGLIRAAGVGRMRVRYDGGNDEGFAHADDMWINGERKSLGEVLNLVTTPANVEAIRVAAGGPDTSQWYKADNFHRRAEPRRFISNVLDELADLIVTELLGSGYGTGEYEMYGALIIDLETGEINDDPDAERPAGGI